MRRRHSNDRTPPSRIGAQCFDSFHLFIPFPPLHHLQVPYLFFPRRYFLTLVFFFLFFFFIRSIYFRGHFFLSDFFLEGLSDMVLLVCFVPFWRPHFFFYCARGGFFSLLQVTLLLIPHWRARDAVMSCTHLGSDVWIRGWTCHFRHR